jgi:hypothetical protein
VAISHTMVWAVIALMPGTFGEIDSEDSIQLTAEVERLRLIPVPLIGRRLGSFGYCWLRGCCCLQTAEFPSCRLSGSIAS